ncbi:protein kinase [Roseiconus nitratireducens]|uniref:Protein kinase n=2 Tax=Roseiconus nitratireducens TaxID=2605748 RepID=A0A5M6D3W7_9BACT|nr:protein kinase [Roseiconus nitratireducens]
MTGIADLKATQASHAEASPTSADFWMPSLQGPESEFGKYKLLEQIGEGGMGTVFMAQQTRPVKRRVAIKIIKPGMDSRQVVARFEAERQALALMEHPNIARVFDGGSTDQGRPYFVMELVKGIPLTDFCQRKKLSLRQRLELFVDVCHAVQHAHHRGVIHRDLKPSNALVTLHDGKPVVKIIDFGIAKAVNQELTDKTLFTQFASMVGTPLYMSPEQAEMSGLDVDTRSDIYSLGVMLYELLTSTTPFDRELLKNKGLDEVRRMIRETEPPRPSQRISTVKAAECDTLPVETLREIKRSKSELSGELDWIAMKALEKDRERRYQSASDFADDINRYLEGDAVKAHPPSVRYRVGRYVRKHRLLLTCAGLVMFAAALGTSASLVFAARARSNAADAVAAKSSADQELARANRLAEERDATAKQLAAEAQRAKDAAQRESLQRRVAQSALYRADVRVADGYLRNGNDADARRTLLAQFPQNGEDDLRSWEWYYLLGKTRLCDRVWYTGSVGNSAEWIDDGDRIFTAGRTETSLTQGSGYPESKVWDTRSGKLLKRIGGLWGVTRRSPDDSKLAITLHATGIYGRLVGDRGVIQILDLETNEQFPITLRKATNPTLLEWNRQGNRIAVACRNDGTVADLQDDSGEVFVNVLQVRGDQAKWEVKYEFNDVHLPVGWSRDDELFAATVRDDESTLQLYDGRTLRPVRKIRVEDDLLVTSGPFAHWHPSEPWIALPTVKHQLVVLNAESGEVTARLDFGQDSRDLRWSPNGAYLAAIGNQGMINVWKAGEWEIVDRISAHDTFGESVSWSSDSDRLLSMGADGYCAIWSLNQPSTEIHVDVSSRTEPGGIAWAGNDTIQYTDGDDNSVVAVQLCNGSRQRIASFLDGENGRMDQANLASQLLNIGQTGYVDIRDLANRRNWRLEVSQTPEYESEWAISRDKQKIAIATNHRLTQKRKIIDIGSGQSTEINVLSSRQLPSVHWSPDGNRVAFAGNEDHHRPAVFIHDALSGEKQIESLIGTLDSGNALESLAWAPDCTKLVVGSPDGHCHLVDANSGSIELAVRPFGGRVRALAWHPSDDRIAVGGGTGWVVVLDAISGEVLLKFEIDEVPHQLEWSPDGQRLAVRLANGGIQVWDAAVGYDRSRSPAIEDYRRESYKKDAWSATAEAVTFFRKGKLTEAIEVLRPWVLSDATGPKAEELHPWAPDKICSLYFLLESVLANQQNRQDDQVDAMVRAARFDRFDRGEVQQLSHLIESGVEVEGFESLVDECYQAFRMYFFELYRLLDAGDEMRVSASTKVHEEIALIEDQFASIYKRGKCTLAKVIEHRELSVRYQPNNAEYLHRLASDYCEDSQIDRAIKTEERVLEIKPDWDAAIQQLDEYRAVLDE